MWAIKWVCKVWDCSNQLPQKFKIEPSLGGRARIYQNKVRGEQVFGKGNNTCNKVETWKRTPSLGNINKKGMASPDGTQGEC